MTSQVLVIGAGGVGTIAAYGLEYGGKAQVTAVIRSDYERVISKGFEITSCDYGKIDCYRPTNVVRTVDEAKKYGPFDYIVVTTKNVPDVSNVEDLIEPAVMSKSAIVLLQNGIDIGSATIDKFPNNIVLSGVSMISSTNYHGKIEHENVDSLKIGYFDNPNFEKKEQKQVAEKFVEIYSNDKNSCVYDEDVKFTRWRKLVYNATLNPICTLTGVDVGRLELFGGVESMVRDTMKEVLAIAKSDGCDIPPETMDIMIRSDDGIYYAPSMLVDLRKGNYMEIEVICGNAIRIAQENKVEAPNLTFIYNLLKIVQCKLKESKGSISVPNDRPIPKQ